VSCFEKNDKVWVGDPREKNSFKAVFVAHDGPPTGFNRDAFVAYKIHDFVNVVRWPVKGLRPR
jgi:hypothetical protein